MTAAGKFTEFTIPTADAGPGGIVAGTDGALWFTEFNAGVIGRVTTKGAFSSFKIPRRLPGRSSSSSARPTYVVHRVEHGQGRRDHDGGQGDRVRHPRRLFVQPRRHVVDKGTMWIPEYAGNKVLHFTP